jgi:hypothetical protein
MPLLHDPIWQWAVSLGLALLLGSAALHKLRRPQVFASVLHGYALLPAWSTLPVGLLLGLLELLAAAGLLSVALRPFAAALAALLLLAYALVLWLSLRRGVQLADCGCHAGARQQGLSGALVGRNLLLSLLALSLWLPPLVRPLGWLDALVGALALLLGVLFYQLANTLLANQSSARELSL